jgi:Cu(I)/Ag(I) efflux system membrane fusion protein
MPGMQGGSMDIPGMDMTGGATVRIRPADIQTFGITFGTVEVRPLASTLRAVGSVDFDETRVVYVAPKFGGWAESLHVNFTGQPVRRGQPLLDVYSPDLVSAQEELLLAANLSKSVGQSRVENVAQDADALLESARRRLGYWDISDAQIAEILETGRVRRTLTLHSPASGIVMTRSVVQGQAFRPGDPLYMIADLSRVWVIAEVFEEDAALLRNGMQTDITIAALPGRVFGGRVEYVYPTLQEKTRSMKARIAVPNPNGQLKPGMYGSVTFTADLGPLLAVPASAVLQTGRRAIAFVDMGSGELMPHELTLGRRGGDYFEVLDGLAEGQRVVTSAQFLLDSESNLAEVMKAMMAQMNTSDMGSMDMPGMEGMDMGGSSAPPADSARMPGMRRGR